MATMNSDGGMEATVSYLKKLDPGKLPLPIFIEVARITVTPILEVVPLRSNKNVTEVLLLEREKSDPVWGGQLHTSGTVIRASDTPGDLRDAFKRITEGELGGVALSGSPRYIDTIFHEVRRGGSTDIKNERDLRSRSLGEK